MPVNTSLRPVYVFRAILVIEASTSILFLSTKDIREGSGRLYE